MRPYTLKVRNCAGDAHLRAPPYGPPLSQRRQAGDTSCCATCDVRCAMGDGPPGVRWVAWRGLARCVGVCLVLTC
jgi:hypothetical protein